ncbi:MAG: HNH endonuclease [Nitrososphaerota archaeon]|nr:HNH endonuclease [Nitrososphaerota archaeon]
MAKNYTAGYIFVARRDRWDASERLISGSEESWEIQRIKAEVSKPAIILQCGDKRIQGFYGTAITIEHKPVKPKIVWLKYIDKLDNPIFLPHKPSNIQCQVGKEEWDDDRLPSLLGIRKDKRTKRFRPCGSRGYADYRLTSDDALRLKRFDPRVYSLLSPIKQTVPTREAPTEEEVTQAANKLDARDEFQPSTKEEARKRTIQSIARRQGQPKFRSELIELYDGKCAITGCDCEVALEAAHIIPYNGHITNHPQNGILLRADIHTLFDLHVLTINEKTMRVVISEELKQTVYKNLDGKKIHLPTSVAHYPSREALKRHRKLLKS